MVFIAILLGIATAGISFFVVPIVWWAGVAISAFGADDRHGQHQWLHPWTKKQEAPEAQVSES